jgi:iron uptake system component EfeO
MAAALVAAMAVAAAGCSTSAPGTTAATAAADAAGTTTPYGPGAAGGTSATSVAAQAATRSYAAQVDTATAAFVSAVDQLQTDASAGDTTAARADELAAQGDYDAFRALETGDSVNGSTLDELAGDVSGVGSFGGLHAVERDLWASGPVDTDTSALLGQAPVAQFLLGRERLGPEAIGEVAVDQLTWVVDEALPVSQEQYSHLGLVDVAATVQAAARAFSAVEPLARLVDPALTTTVAGRFSSLDTEVATLGNPTTVPDTAVTAPERLAVSQELDATASTLARLTAALTPFGTSGTPS